MTRKEAQETEAMLGRLQSLGIRRDDAESLRRISMTLHRWHELECGTDGGCIERDEPAPVYPEGKPYWLNSMTGRRYPVADRERGARRRLFIVMTRYPTLLAYVQTDPRGASLYILRATDVPAGENVDAYYSRGVAVFK